VTAEDPPQDRIPPPDFLGDAAPAAVLAALPGARAVGGCVRMRWRGARCTTWTSQPRCRPRRSRARLRDAGLRVFETGLAHGTVTAVLGRDPVEVTALRRDLVTDGRHAEVAWTTDWREDAARAGLHFQRPVAGCRGRPLGLFRTARTTSRRPVRFVGDPATRLAEDYLRALRFFRFWARYGRARRMRRRWRRSGMPCGPGWRGSRPSASGWS
jgi:poly(A) polymerase/tRNA nucleotidyltransferase (CCA-adding enzyme)